ncbi:MAG: hemolysin family protein [Nitrospira sp.]|nr:hemolysin family protein [Nitrospira sp.]MCP9461912.1 hemolysin family protein [Nitrospira sp.]MCP9475000.1 hemolysin family protein [Nitrospira sp.]
MDILILLGLIGLSVVISTAEIGFFAVNETRLRALAQNGSKRAAKALLLRSDPQKLLSTILVGDRLVSTAIPMYATFMTLNIYGGKSVFEEAIAIMVGLLTFVLLVSVDVIPKTLAAKFAVPVTLNMAYPVYWVQVLMKPLLFVMVPLIYKLTGGKGLTLPLVTEEELKIMLDQGGKAGELEVEEVKMIKNVFQLKDITAEDAMTPRIYVFALDGSLRLKDAEEMLYNSKYSRIPVYDGTLDNITGILYKTKALIELAKGHSDLRLQEIAQPPLFVPAGKTADDLMKQFQQEKRHMGIVVNEFGGVMGLVTLEDLLEEVVGEIVDETDITEELIKRIGKNQILVHGRTEVRKVNEFLKVDLGDDALTIGGLIQENLGRIPKTGEEIRIENCRLVVHEADPRSIRSVQIFKEEKAPVPVETPPTLNPVS